MNPTSFERDRLTVLQYLLVGYLSHLLTVLTPAMSFLRSELGYNLAQGSLHLSFSATGSILIGLVGSRIVERIGRHTSLWLGTFGQVGGLMVVTFGQSLPVTLLGALTSGFFFALLLSTTQAVLSDRHGQNRALAIAESNVVATLASMLGPFLVGALERNGISWRGAIYASALVAVALVLVFRNTPVPESRPADSQMPGVRQRLPRAFWVCALATGIGTAVEWSVLFWAPEFLEKVVGLSKVDAATMVSLFFLAVLIGRVAGSALSRRVHSGTLFIGAFMLTGIGFVLLWLGQSTPINLLGLILSGMGIANQYPQGIALSLAAAADQSTQAAPRISLLVGTSIFSAPLILGGIADQIGVFKAYGLVVILIAAGLVGAFIANRLSRQSGIGS